MSRCLENYELWFFILYNCIPRLDLSSWIDYIENEQHHWFLLVEIFLVYKVSANTELANTEPLNSVQLLSCVRLFVTPWIAARQASLSNTNSQSLLKLMSFESVIPSNHLILCHTLLLLPSIFSSIRVFSNESVLHIRWPKYWEFQLQQQSFQWIFRNDFL